MQVIDQKNLFLVGISFVQHENNKGYKKLLNHIFLDLEQVKIMLGNSIITKKELMRQLIARTKKL